MAINRAPFNALVDDAGTGTAGTPWNKLAIKDVLLDPIDAAIGGVWTDVPFSAANFSALTPMTWTVGAAAVLRNRYTVVNKILFWSFYVSWFSGANVIGGSPATTLFMTFPAGLTAGAPGAQNQPIVYTAGLAGVPVTGGLLAGVSPGGVGLSLTKAAGGNYALADVPGLITTLIFEVA